MSAQLSTRNGPVHDGHDEAIHNGGVHNGVVKIGRDDIPPNRRRGGEIRVVLGPRTVGSTSGFLGTLDLAPSEFVAEHYHPYSEEFLYVVSGEMDAKVDGQPIHLVAGEGLMVPIGIRHRVENNGTVPARAVFHLAPLAPQPALGHVDTEPLPNPHLPPPAVAAPAEGGAG
ncbi:MAG: cupin domain-containing protein [Micromonosporaceae bacterium]|nr:cupin domain-containing protein [Micromonosporaceae bacterium]